MTAARLAIRDARLPEDEPHLLRFIDGLQRFEHAVEPNRRLDDRVARDYLDVLLTAAKERDGRVLVADVDGAPAGWAVALVEDEELFVVEAERRYGYVSELYLDEAARGLGAAGALMAGCEDHFRGLGIKVARIGVLEGNDRARAVYEHQGYVVTSLRLRKYL